MPLPGIWFGVVASKIGSSGRSSVGVSVCLGRLRIGRFGFFVSSSTGSSFACVGALLIFHFALRELFFPENLPRAGSSPRSATHRASRNGP